MSKQYVRVFDAQGNEETKKEWRNRNEFVFSNELSIWGKLITFAVDMFMILFVVTVVAFVLAGIVFGWQTVMGVIVNFVLDILS